MIVDTKTNGQIPANYQQLMYKKEMRLGLYLRLRGRKSKKLHQQLPQVSILKVLIGLSGSQSDQVPYHGHVILHHEKYEVADSSFRDPVFGSLGKIS